MHSWLPHTSIRASINSSFGPSSHLPFRAVLCFTGIAQARVYSPEVIDSYNIEKPHHTSHSLFPPAPIFFTMCIPIIQHSAPSLPFFAKVIRVEHLRQPVAFPSHLGETIHDAPKHQLNHDLRKLVNLQSN